MDIIHNLDNLFYALFPDAIPGDNKSIQQEVARYYSTPFFTPDVSVRDDRVIIHINTDQLESLEKDYKKAVALCESRKFSEAKILLASLIEKNPTNSEFYRILGQIHSEEGDRDTATNYLIEALKWNNKNTYALTMMGNILFLHKQDTDTALIYFNQVLKINPNDHLALNNLGSQLGKLGKMDEARSYLERALAVNPEFPNTHLGLGILSDNSGNHTDAFHHYLQALKFNPNHDELFERTMGNIVELCSRIVENDIGNGIIEKYKTELETRSGVKIEIEPDESVPYYAKIEYAEIYNRDHHVVKFKPSKPGIVHLIMHELTHLKFVLDARDAGKYELITSDEKNKEAFYEFAQVSIMKLRARGIAETDISNFVSSIRDGLISQLFNTPIDLFIEDYLYNQFEELRPYQFISLLSITKESIRSVIDPQILEIASEHIVSKSKIYNMVNGFQFRDLFHIDIEDEFHASPKERKHAEGFYKEFLKHRDSKQPGIEYELITSWSKRLDLGRFFHILPEEEYLKLRNLEESFLDDEPRDTPPSSDVTDEDVEMAKFLRNQEIQGLNKSIVFYMIGALEYFKNMSVSDIKNIAMEIARIGMNGISPDKEGYTVPSIPDKTFSGNHLLAYYYVSWKLAIPEMVDKLQLPFREEFEMAERIFRG